MSNTHVILSNKVQVLGEHTSVSVGNGIAVPALYTTFQATASDNGGTITSGTVLIEVSNDEVQWVTMGTISVTTDGTTDGFAANAAWKFVRSNVTALGGTGLITVSMGV